MTFSRFYRILWLVLNSFGSIFWQIVTLGKPVRTNGKIFSIPAAALAYSDGFRTLKKKIPTGLNKSVYTFVTICWLCNWTFLFLPSGDDAPLEPLGSLALGWEDPILPKFRRHSHYHFCLPWTGSDRQFLAQSFGDFWQKSSFELQWNTVQMTEHNGGAVHFFHSKKTRF